MSSTSPSSRAFDAGAPDPAWAALDHVDEAVLIVHDDEGATEPRIAFANRAFAFMSGYAPDELLGRPIREAQGDAPDPIDVEGLRRQCRQGEACVLELTSLRRDGSPYLARWSVGLLGDRGRAESPHWLVKIQRISEEADPTQLFHGHRHFASHVMEAIQAVVLVLDQSGRIDWFNPHMAGLSGYSLQEVRGQDWFTTFLPPEDRKPIRILFNRAVEGQRVRGSVNTILTRDGRKRQIEWSSSELKDADGRVDRIVAIGHDVTQRAQTRQALSESQSQLQEQAAALSRLNDASSRLWRATNLRMGLDEMLDATIKLLGADMGNIQLLDADRSVLTIEAQRGFDRNFLDAFHEVSTEDETACGRALRAGERVVIFDVEADAAFAPYRDIARAAGFRGVQSTPLMAHNGTPRGMISTHFRSPHMPTEQDLRRLDLYARHAADFIERCGTEQTLRDREKKLEAILNTAAEGIITIGERGLIESLNAEAENIFGYRAEEVVGRNVSILMPRPFSDQHDGYLKNYLDTGVAKIIGTTRELTGRRRNGETFPMELSISEVSYDDHRLFTGFVRDISVRKSLERELVETSARERQWVGQDLHDGLGQELTGLAFMASSLREALAESHPELAALAATIDTTAKQTVSHARAIVKGLCPVSTDRHGLQMSLQELAHTVQHAYQLNCRFHCDRDVDILSPATTMHAYYIANEAVNNAIKHGQAKRIDIRLARQAGRITLGVEDDGVGFDHGDAQGKGRGLQIMRFRARLIDGEVQVDSRAGEGTAVRATFLLPEA